ncbi:MAG: hypothetical protein K8R54_11370 [Bacteroidales bacterium]|nr:hypothetical protein [Bacteroidales bacterium]
MLKNNILILFLFVFAVSCNNSDNHNVRLPDNTNRISKTNKIKDSVSNSNADYADKDFDIIKGKSVVFFSLNKKEYNIFINRMGKHTKWEFDIIYNNFKRTAGNAAEPLKNINIRSTYTTEKILTFITADKDTLYFNRDNEDYFVGQIFFDGKDSLYIVEGLFKANNLEEMIIDFFDIKNDFNISSVAQISDSFRYFTPDTSAVISEDTIIPKL